MPSYMGMPKENSNLPLQHLLARRRLTHQLALGCSRVLELYSMVAAQGTTVQWHQI